MAEPVTAGLLAVPGIRPGGGWAAAGLLPTSVAAHLHMFRVVPPRSPQMAVTALRLPLQLPLVRAALRVARPR